MLSVLGRPSAALCVISVLLLPSLAIAQQSKVMAPHESVAPKMKKPVPLPAAAQGSMVGGPWMVDANFKSTVYLKNVVETSPITVTPVLHLSNGVQYVLPVVTLEPGGTGTIDLNGSLQNLGISSSATLSGYMELQYQWPWVPLCAFIRDVDVVHSVIFTFGVQASGIAPPSPQQSASQVAEGVWWKQEPNVTGFVTLANISAQAITAIVQVSDDHAAVLGTQTITVSAHGMKTLHLQELLTAPTNQGGLRINYVGQQGTLLINGGLEDANVGYSANIYFSADPINLPSRAKLIPQNGVAELGLMVGAADPMMRFPAGTTFTPYSVLRNVSNMPITVTPTLWWMQSGAPASTQLPQLRLLPFETRSLDMPSLLATAGLTNFTGSVNLVFDYQAKSGLLLAAGSVDQTNTYVFEVAPRAIGKSAGKSVSYWSTANGDDTMITIWNPADEAQDFIFRIDFTGGHYLLPIHLDARATRTFNISEIIQTQVPDVEGNTIPAAIQSGSAKLYGSQADNQHILAAMDGGIYNVVKATCGGYCYSCDGATGYYALIDGFYVPIGQYTSESLMAQWSTGGQYDLTNQSSWSSNNTNIATVQAGSVHGVGGGKVTIVASDSTVPDYVPYQCFGFPFNCAQAEGGGGSASGDVFQFVVNGPQYIFVGTDPNIVSANTYFATNGAGGAPQPSGGTCCAASSDQSDLINVGTGQPITIRFTTLDQSINVGDRLLTFEYDLPDGNGTSQQMNVTARQFAYLANDNPSNQCTTTYGTMRDYTYTVYTHPDHAAVLPDDGLDGTAVSESFNPPLQCQTITGNGNLNSNGQIVDHISSGCSNSPLTCTQTAVQTLSVAGYQVRANTLQWTNSQVIYTNNGPTQ